LRVACPLATERFLKVDYLHKQQNSHIQSNTQTNQKLQNTIVGYFEHRNPKRFQSKVLRINVDAPWYVPNTVIRTDLQTPTAKAETRRYSSQYSARLSVHPNDRHGATRQRAIAKTPAKRFAYQILGVIVLFVVYS
jgi:hypothetical protein